jgi:hypothetical protein
VAVAFEAVLLIADFLRHLFLKPKLQRQATFKIP